MEKSKIGDVILTLRKKRGLTQEQLAAKVGVSAGAVSKWETGGSSPDIFLLGPLARALDATPDELLSFRKEPPEEDIHRIKQELTALYLFEGYAAGEAKGQAYLREYPNSGRLKLMAAGLSQMYLGIKAEIDEEEAEVKLRQALALLQEAAEDCRGEYRQEALYISAGIHMRLKEPEAAEALLKGLLPERLADPMNLYPAVLLELGKHQEAAEQCAKQLLYHVMISAMMLATMARASGEAGREEDRLLCLTAEHKLESLFGTGMGAGARGLALHSLRTGQFEEAARWFAEYVNTVLTTGPDYRNNPFFGTIKLEVAPSGQMEIRKHLLASLLEEKEWGPLSGLAPYEEAMARIRARLEELEKA